jgi:hypothetical protein
MAMTRYRADTPNEFANTYAMDNKTMTTPTNCPHCEFINDGLPENYDLGEHYVWANRELTRRRAYSKDEISRIIGQLKQENTQLAGDKLRAENAELTAALNEIHELTCDRDSAGVRIGRKSPRAHAILDIYNSVMNGTQE